ncbi:hypothetical protein [Clostridium sp. VAP51]|uniref:hypothetical protein n=1 Tax=Clostridium sp. VAP51 TaxID=2949978 RepID=UPI002079D8CF|nr:hypothetical protein [Clostridium sp. VAP51]
MYKLFYALLSIIWVLDIINIPGMEFLDTQIPINFLAWLLIWLCLPSTKTIIKQEDSEEESIH